MLADAGGGVKISSFCRACHVMLEVLLAQVHKHRSEDVSSQAKQSDDKVNYRCLVLLSMLLHAGSAVNTLLLSDHGERRMKGSQTCTVRADKNVTHE